MFSTLFGAHAAAALTALIQQYGYGVVLVGTFLEGETVLVLAGFAAHRGYLTLWGVMLAAFAGSLAGDQFFFYLGRRHSKPWLRRFPAWRLRLARVNTLLNRHRLPLILGFRFLYGLRTVTPFVFGMGEIRAGRFFLLNAAGAAVWAVVFGTGGYLFGNVLEWLLGDLRRIEIDVLIGLAAGGLMLWLVHWLRLRRRENRS